ncbi:hypothetical protein ACFS07_00160 [Undibacterium arcticum]
MLRQLGLVRLEPEGTGTGIRAGGGRAPLLAPVLARPLSAGVPAQPASSAPAVMIAREIRVFIVVTVRLGWRN